jgi:hypothetical protein
MSESRIVEIGNFVVRDFVVRRRTDPHADRAGKQQPAVANDIIVHAIVARVILRLRLVVERADFDPAGSHVGDETLLDQDLATSLLQ